jgi:formylglycine-generating enzyme required for sulfatase activity
MKKFIVQGLLLLLCIVGSACASTTPPPTVPVNLTPVPADAMVLIPAGSFMMGLNVDKAMDECKKYRPDCMREWFSNSEPVHSVDLPAFYMDVYEVTNGNYKVCVTEGKCQPPRLTKSATHEVYYGNPQFDNYPVVNVNWTLAKTYCEWRGARLPTEAEWERAARSTDQRTFAWGEGLDTNHANYSDSKIGDPTAVGSYELGKSQDGIYDLTGNVWEWVADEYNAYPGGSATAHPDFGKKFRAIRGGAWFDPGNSIIAGYRGGLDPGHDFGNIGFRCARDGG